MNMRDYIGKRCLLRLAKSYSGAGDVKEFTVLEVSDSGNWVKLKSDYGGQKFWKALADISLVEVLQQFEPRPL